jgi:anti-sigma regulatory factor (Ser/Thr protein kinase)
VDKTVTLVRNRFALSHLQRLRQAVIWAARRVGLDAQREQSLALAATEAASNAIQHGGGGGELTVVQDDGRALIVEVRDHGPGMPANAQAGRPPTDQVGGRGLYLIHKLCDRVGYRTGPGGTTVRLEMNLR